MNSCEKGKRGERQWRDVLRANGYEARRGQQFSGSKDSPDVVSNLPIHFEVKLVDKLRLRDAVAQASADSAGGAWAIATRWDNGTWLVIQAADDWFKCVRGDYSDPAT